jgi:hypothetical protein
MESLTWFVAGIGFLISLVHFYWVFGGKKGFWIAVPSTDGDPLFRPTRAATAVIAVLLAAVGLFVLQLGGYEMIHLPKELLLLGGWALAMIFLLRAIGDFRWLGFFKSKKGSPFAKWDTVLYSPLCLLLGICLIIVLSV